MTNRFITLAAAAALFLGVYGQARADNMVPITTIGHWQISADATLCKADGAYQDGTLLTFYINEKGAASIAVEHPKWSIPRGTYEIFMQVDRAPPTVHKATGNNSYVIWP